MQPRKVNFPGNLTPLSNTRTREDAKKGSLFMSQTEASQFCLHVNEDGNLCFANNEPLESEIRIKDKIKQNPFKFIITLKGEIIAAPKFDKNGNKISGPANDAKMAPSIKHSTLCQGDKVLFGGELYFHAGKIVKITNESGHYLPDVNAFSQVLRFFEKLGVMSSQFSQIGRCYPLAQRKEPTMFWVKGLAAFENRFLKEEKCTSSLPLSYR